MNSNVYVTVMAAAVVDGNYYYAYQNNGVVENVVDHICDEMRLYDRETFRTTLIGLNKLDNVVIVSTAKTYSDMGKLLSKYHNLNKEHIIVHDSAMFAYKGDVMVRVINENVSRETLNKEFGGKVFVLMGGKRVFDAIQPDTAIVTEFAIPTGQQQRFLTNGIATKPLKKYKRGETFKRCTFGNWKVRSMYLTDLSE